LILSPLVEQQALEAKRAELALLEAELSARAAELSRLRAELRAFEHEYLSVVGRRYAELQEVEERLAELQGLKDAVAAEAEGWEAANELNCGQNKFTATEKLKRLYREVARKFHPDLAATEDERHHRHQLMVEINRAYESGAEERLEALLTAETSYREWASSTLAATELIQLARAVANAREQLIELHGELDELKASELYKLRLRVERAQAEGVDFLGNLVAQVDRQIRKAKNRLDWLEGIEPALSA